MRVQTSSTAQLWQEKHQWKHADTTAGTGGDDEDEVEGADEGDNDNSGEAIENEEAEAVENEAENDMDGEVNVDNERGRRRR